MPQSEGIQKLRTKLMGHLKLELITIRLTSTYVSGSPMSEENREDCRDSVWTT